MRVWSYWEDRAGTSQPAIIKHCLETLQKQAGLAGLEVVTPATAADFVNDLDPRWRAIPSIAHRADYLRSRLLRDHGGLWCDADLIGIAPLEPVLNHLATSDLVATKNRESRTSISFLASRPGTATMTHWADAQQHLLENSGFKVSEWNGIGSSLLSQFVEPEGTVWLDPARVKPFPWYEDHLLLSKVISPQRLFRADTLTVSLYRRTWERLGMMDTDELMKSRSLACRVLRISLGVDDPVDWWRPTDVLAPAPRGATVIRRRAARLLNR